MQTPLSKEIEKYISQIFNNNSTLNYYHNYSHTKSVVNNVEEIAFGTNLNNDEIETLKIAAWFHDVGYIRQREQHEQLSVEYLTIFLHNKNLPNNKINVIANCILATKIPPKPHNILEKTICDADLKYVGTTKFFELNYLLRLEFESVRKQKYSELEWIEKNISFMMKHKFFTDYAKNKYENQKEQNLLKLIEIKKSL